MVTGINIAQVTMAALLSWNSIIFRHIELEDISVSQIWNLITVY